LIKKNKFKSIIKILKINKMGSKQIKIKSKEELFYESLNKNKINVKDCFVREKINCEYNENLLINFPHDLHPLIICPICLNILSEPVCCSLSNIPHSFCKKCIEKNKKYSNKCPICKQNFNGHMNYEKINLLNYLKFKCPN
jgi:hypothetical protein